MHVTDNYIRKYSFALALLLVMAVYLPVNYFGAINFDDMDVIQRIHRNFSNFNWYKLFFRGVVHVYYRPLLETLCVMDYALWGLAISAWHLTNYVIHILNAVLVYLIALKWFHNDENGRILSVFAMLFFALNPMTCESVAWISGRSDLTSTFFSLIALYMIYSGSVSRFVLVPLAVLAGLLCKENALAVIPVIVLLKAYCGVKQHIGWRGIVKKCLLWSCIVSIPLVVYYLMRTSGQEQYTQNYTNAVASLAKSGSTQMGLQPIISRFLFLLPVTAFYIKKLFFPFPLNFAITQINETAYWIFSAVIAVFNAYCMLKKKWSIPFFTVLIIISFSPSLMIALGGVSWAPMAERYLYLTLCIMGIGMAAFFNNLQKKGYLSTAAATGICMIIILVSLVSTFDRQFDFKDGKSLWPKTFELNRESSMVLFKYAQTVGGEEGYEAFKKAAETPGPFAWRDEAYLFMARYESFKGDNDEAVKSIEKALAIEKNYKNYLSAVIILINSKSEDPLIEKENIKRAVTYYKKAYEIKQTVFVLYKTATLLDYLEEKEEAEQIYNEIIQKHPNSKWAGYARKHLED